MPVTLTIKISPLFVAYLPTLFLAKRVWKGPILVLTGVCGKVHLHLKELYSVAATRLQFGKVCTGAHMISEDKVEREKKDQK